MYILKVLCLNIFNVLYLIVKLIRSNLEKTSQDFDFSNTLILDANFV